MIISRRERKRERERRKNTEELAEGGWEIGYCVDLENFQPSKLLQMVFKIYQNA